MCQQFGTCSGCYNHLLCMKDNLCTEPLACDYYYPVFGDINSEEIYDEEQTRRLAYQEVLDQFK